MENSIENALEKVLVLLENANPIDANDLINKSLKYDLDNENLLLIQKYCFFWKSSFSSVIEMDNPYERGERLLDDWKKFVDYAKSLKESHEKALYALKIGVWTFALKNYNLLLDESDTMQKAEIYRKIGICYKKLGRFSDAKNFLGQANVFRPGQANVLAELADCHALCGDDKAAKVLFREAFFIDFKKIEIAFLDCEMIRCLIEKVEQKGFKDELLNAWLPVYAVIWGVFNVRRDLKSQEIGKLKQDIYALENENKDPSRTPKTLVPHLINMYFWLIDYCHTKNDTILINETLLKIKILDANIYALYVK